MLNLPSVLRPIYMSKNVIHLDCTLRDGGYYTDWDFTTELINEYLHAVNAACVDYAELGFRFFKNQGFKGSCAFTTDQFIETLEIPEGLKISIMINADELFINGKLDIKRLEKLVPNQSKNTRVDLIRIASHFNQLDSLLPAFEYLKHKGYTTACNIMQISEISHNELISISDILSISCLDILYFADSLGSIKPEEITEIILALSSSWKGPIGIHAHDNMGLALSNTLQAIKDNASWVDSTITGMGRGPGNAKTEQLLIELETNPLKKFNLVPLLNLIKTRFNPLKNKHLWGTNPYYYLAGKYSIHPSYIQSMLSDKRYSDEDVLAVIGNLKSQGGSKFNFNELVYAKNFYHGSPRGTWSPKDLLLNKEVLILGSGPKLSEHRNAIERFISCYKPIVIAMNTQTQISNHLIDLRIACHPIRLMADIDVHLRSSQPLVTPASMLPVNLSDQLKSKKLLDYGIGISKNSFQFLDQHCIVPNPLVFSYAISLVVSGKAKKIYLAGYDGYKKGDPRNQEIDELLEIFFQAKPGIDFIAITPTQYKGLKSISVYGI